VPRLDRARAMCEGETTRARVCRAVKIRFDRGHVGTSREDTLTF